MKKVVFVCTGNFYRSRFAEAWFNFQKSDSLGDWIAVSRGLFIECAPISISPHTREEIEKHNIPKECYQPIPVSLSQEDLNDADLVIAMLREEHFPMMQKKFPDWSEKIRYWSICDLDQWTPSQTLPAIQIQVGLLIEELSIS